MCPAVPDVIGNKGKIMKKIIAFSAAIVVAATLGGASILRAVNPGIKATATAGEAYVTSAQDGNVSREYDLSGFDELDISGPFKVTLTKSKEYRVKLSVPEEYAGKVIVRTEKDELKIGVNDKLFHDTKWKSLVFTAEISMPALRSLELSGAVDFECDDTFDLANGEFSLEQSGASKVKSLSVKAGEFEAELSGAAVCKMDGEFDEADLEMSGAAEASMKLSGRTLKVENSGAAKTKVDGKFDRVSLESSGAGEITINGASGSLRIDAGGAAKVKAGDFVAENASVQTSGAASCTVNVSGKLTVEDASGASSIRYRGTSDVKVVYVARAASLKKID